LKPEKLETYHSTESSPCASTARTDGEHGELFGSFGLICYDRKGNELWRLPCDCLEPGDTHRNLVAVAGNLVVVIRDRDEGSSLLAVDLRTGKKVWETARPDSHEALERPSPGRMPCG